MKFGLNPARWVYVESPAVTPRPLTLAQPLLGFLEIPVHRPAGYYDATYVSWTMPKELRPFNYTLRYAAGGGPDEGTLVSMILMTPTAR